MLKYMPIFIDITYTLAERGNAMKTKADALEKRTLESFRGRKIMTVGEVAESIDSTVHTARRRLKQWGAITSYNRNGRYYALPDVPGFPYSWRRSGTRSWTTRSSPDG